MTAETGSRDLRLLLIGAPGSGKGTQAVALARRFNITHISSGDLLRQHVQRATALGQVVQKYVHAGDLVPDGVVMDMLRKPVLAAAENGGFVLDGFPRSVEQAEAAYRVARELGVHVQAAIHLDVPSEVLVQRLLARSRGAEDSPDVIEHRLAVYERKTVPLVDYYRRREWVITIDGTLSTDEVHEAIVGELSGVGATPRNT